MKNFNNGKFSLTVKDTQKIWWRAVDKKSNNNNKSPG